MHYNLSPRNEEYVVIQINNLNNLNNLDNQNNLNTFLELFLPAGINVKTNMFLFRLVFTYSVSLNSLFNVIVYFLR